MVAGRTPEKVSALASTLDAEACTLDVTDPGAVDDCLRHAVERFGSVAGVVNCVGAVLLKPAHLTKDEEWHQVIAVNLTSAFAAVKAGVNAMRATGGAVVLVSTAATRIGLANHEAVAAAKGGVNGLTRSAAATYAPWGIRVNAVAPGLTRTPQTRRITEHEGAAKASLAMHALGRFGEPDDVASAIVYLVDPANSWITGQVLGVDGGLGVVRSR